MKKLDKGLIGYIIMQVSIFILLAIIIKMDLLWSLLTVVVTLLQMMAFLLLIFSRP